MIARAEVVVAAGGRLVSLVCQPPLTVRQVASADVDMCALCLVGSAAGPLAGDDLGLRLEVLAGARATVQATGAAIAQGRPGDEPGRLGFRAVLGADATLHADPGPLIVRAGGRVEASVEIDLGPGASVTWREVTVLGSRGRDDSTRGPGTRPDAAATLRWDVTRSERPLLRQLTDLTDPDLAAWPGMLARQRVLATALLAGNGVRGRTIVATPTAVAQRLADDAVLITALAGDGVSAQRMVGELSAAIAPRLAG